METSSTTTLSEAEGEDTGKRATPLIATPTTPTPAFSAVSDWEDTISSFPHWQYGGGDIPSRPTPPRGHSKQRPHKIHLQRDDEARAFHLIAHATLMVTLKDLLAAHRRFLGLEDYWSVTVEVVCPQAMPDHEAVIWWDAEVFFACMRFRCDLSPALYTWDLQHEVLELRGWRTAGAVLDLCTGLLPGEQTEHLLSAWKVARNQEIELELQRLLGETDLPQRPAHLRTQQEEAPFTL